MVKRIISSLVVFCLVVGGMSVLQAEGANSVEQGAKSKEQKGNLKTQGSNLKAQPVKTVRIMNTTSKKMIEEIFEMVIEERVEDGEKYFSCDLHPIYPTWSPDNKKVAYILPEGIGYGGIETEGQIWLRDLATLDDTSVYLGINATEPDFSPDGKQIVCVMTGKIPQVYKMSIDGKNKIQLTNFKEDKYWLCPKWSPDGKKILVHLADICFIKVESSEEIKIYSERGGFKGDWSPDGKKIALISKNDLWVINSDGTNPVQITTDGNVHRDYTPSWSPNGKKIAYTVYGDEKCPNYIMIINTDGSNPTKLLLPNNMFGICPVWSKDGKRLLIVGKKDIKHPLEKYEHYATGMYILTLPESVLK